MLGRPFKVMVLGSLAAVTAASTQGAVADRGARVVLRGHVTATGSIHIRQANGRHVRYRGPMPGQSLRHGAAVAIGFTTRDLQGTGDVQQDYAGQTAINGIYNITVTPSGEAGSTALAYDAVNDTYALAGDGAADPGMAYDAQTGQPFACSPDCFNADTPDQGQALASGDSGDTAVAGMLAGADETTATAETTELPVSADATPGLSDATPEPSDATTASTDAISGPADAAAGFATASAEEADVADAADSTGSVAMVGGSISLDSPELGASASNAAEASDASGQAAPAAVESLDAALPEPAASEAGSTPATEVPAPGMLLLFAVACAALPLRRWAVRRV